jgi:O-antigen ligase
VGEALSAFERAAPASVAALGSMVLGIADGGFFARTWGPTIVAFVVAVELALLVYSRVELSWLELAVLALLGAFVGWSALSAVWSVDSTVSLREAERALLYLVALLAMLLMTRRGFSVALAYGVLGAATFVSWYGLVEYLVARPPFDPFEGTLLFEPLGYANAVGILAAIGAVLSCGLALEASSFAQAVARAVPLAVLIPTLVLTESRGAWAGMAVALVVLVALRFRLRRAHVIALVALLAIGVALVVWSSGGDFYGERPTFWRIAWRDYRDNPALGSGAGTYVYAWGGTLTPSGGVAVDAHSLYLESLAELGPVGLALLTGTLGLPLLAIRRSGLATVAGAAYVAFLVHAAIDFDWEMPAVTLAALGCAAILLVEQREDTTLVRVSTRLRVATALLAAAVAIAVLAGGTFP